MLNVTCATGNSNSKCSLHRLQVVEDVLNKVFAIKADMYSTAAVA